VFADRPGHSHGGLLILKLRPLFGFKIMIWYTVGTQDVRKRSTLPTGERTKSPNWAGQSVPLRQRMRPRSSYCSARRRLQEVEQCLTTPGTHGIFQC
jgi:hypothetical protein